MRIKSSGFPIPFQIFQKPKSRDIQIFSKNKHCMKNNIPRTRTNGKPVNKEARVYRTQAAEKPSSGRKKTPGIFPGAGISPWRQYGRISMRAGDSATSRKAHPSTYCGLVFRSYPPFLACASRRVARPKPLNCFHHKSGYAPYPRKPLYTSPDATRPRWELRAWYIPTVPCIKPCLPARLTPSSCEGDKDDATGLSFSHAGISRASILRDCPLIVVSSSRGLNLF